jgi:hypothetical protein
MPELEDTFSPHATRILDAYFRSIPRRSELLQFDSDHIVRYVTGALPYDIAAQMETLGLVDAGLRKDMAEYILQLTKMQRTPFADLLDTSAPEKFNGEVLRPWTSLVLSHINSVSTHLREAIPNTWPELARLSEAGPAEKLAAKTIRRALAIPKPLPPRGILPLGSGYRLGSRGASESLNVTSHVEGQVNEDGLIEIAASFDHCRRGETAFFALSLNECFLPLASAEVIEGIARVRVPGVAAFMNLGVGPIDPEVISIQLGDWPDESKTGAIIVESNRAPRPTVQSIQVKNGNLELLGYFEDPQMNGVWELLLAVCPNTWQLMAQFEISSLIERPQILLAKLPGNLREGPFGGALWLRRVNSQKV